MTKHTTPAGASAPPVDGDPREWPIKEVARDTGITSRTLRHYEQIGLLLPSRVAANGYRFYGEAELARLYRILSLRALGMPLADIQRALAGNITLTDAMTAHLALLHEQREQLERHISAVTHALHAATEGHPMTIREMFDGVDPAQYEAEVRERWGDDAWERSAKRRAALSDEELRADADRSVDVNAALADAARAGEDPAGAAFQRLVAVHHRWVTEQWGGRVPDAAAYGGLAELYVADERFAAVYGGQQNAELIRSAMLAWAAAHLSPGE